MADDTEIRKIIDGISGVNDMLLQMRSYSVPKTKVLELLDRISVSLEETIKKESDG